MASDMKQSHSRGGHGFMTSNASAARRAGGLTIVSTRALSGKQLEAIRAIRPDATITEVEEEGVSDAIGSADIVAGAVDEAALARAKRLRWIHSWTAGQDEQLFPSLIESDVILTSSKGNGAIPLAEHAMLLMLMLNRNAVRWVDAQREHRWDRYRHSELNGLTCGIIGAGNSGSDLAIKAKAFHMRVLGLRRSKLPAPEFDALYGLNDLHRLLRESDFVVVTTPLTPETRGMLGEAEFRAMKPSAHYICISRGGVADDEALYRALTENWIAGAGLDAHLTEPLPPGSPFWDLPNVIITPHNGATTWATLERAFDIFLDNLRRFVAGEALVNVVDKQSGY